MAGPRPGHPRISKGRPRGRSFIWSTKLVGKAKLKRQAHAAILAKHSACLYCAGTNTATTIEHMPPIAVFEGRQRPKGFEFPACGPCNNGTSHSVLVAAMLA